MPENTIENQRKLAWAFVEDLNAKDVKINYIRKLEEDFAKLTDKQFNETVDALVDWDKVEEKVKNLKMLQGAKARARKDDGEYRRSFLQDQKDISSMDNITTEPMSEGDKKITKTDFESQSFDG